MLTEAPDISVRPSNGPGIYADPVSTSRFAYEQACRIILVHGFRNSEAEALAAYKNFKDYFSRYASAFSEKVFSFVWPGDYFGMNPLRYFDYNTRNSVEAGIVLGGYLHDMATRYTPACQFIIVAHSLGCRLTAAMVREIHRRDPELCKRFKIVLMAGAVPCTDVTDPNMFGVSLRSASYIANLYSENDEILRLLFPAGEFGAGRSLSEPIGLHGGPVSFEWSKRQPMAGFGHSDYWRKSTAAEFVARLVGANIDHEMPIHEIAENAISNHEIRGASGTIGFDF